MSSRQCSTVAAARCGWSRNGIGDPGPLDARTPAQRTLRFPQGGGSPSADRRFHRANLHGNYRERRREILQGGVIRDDEPVAMLQQFRQRFRLRIGKERILSAQNVHIRQNSSLRRQEERVASRSGSELLDMIRGHRVQEARPILAHPDFAATGNVQPRRVAAKVIVALHSSSRNPLGRGKKHPRLSISFTSRPNRVLRILRLSRTNWTHRLLYVAFPLSGQTL